MHKFILVLVALWIGVGITYKTLLPRPSSNSVLEFCENNPSTMVNVSVSIAVLHISVPVLPILLHPHVMAVVSGPINGTIGFINKGITSPDLSRIVIWTGSSPVEVKCKNLLQISNNMKPYKLFMNNCGHFVHNLINYT
jgi:hypothetical protein